MIEVRRTVEFGEWLRTLRDVQGRVRILRRIERAQAGNLGDVGAVGGGVLEMRLFFGPGYRIYFVERGNFEGRGGAIILLLCGGDKASRHRDIERAQALAREYG
jgi:putative addiction module killer protein